MREREFGRETDSPLEGHGFEISAPRYPRWSRGSPRYATLAKQRVTSEFVSTHCKGELGFDFRLTGFDSEASSPVCRLESLRIPLKARICAKATGSKKSARRGKVRLEFGTFDPVSAQAGLSPHGRSVACKE